MSNFSMVNVSGEARTELHDKLGLTGAEVSINNLPAGAGVPFFHSHKQNEEIYVVFSGKGVGTIDGETFDLTAGDCIRVAPAASRKFSAADDFEFNYLCIQVKENSLEGYSMADASIEE